VKIFSGKLWLVIIPVLILGLGWACGGGNGNSSSSSSPNAPSNIQAITPFSSQVDLIWTDNSDNEFGFKIERKTGAEGTYSQIGTVLAEVTIYQDTGLACETTYYYRVLATNEAGDSGYSNEADVTMGTCPITVPAAPSDLTAAIISSSQINLSWTDNSNNEDGFKIERKTGSGGTYTQVGTVVANAFLYQSTGLPCATTYYYRVRANNAAGDSGYSNETNATTSACPLIAPTAPSGLTATVVSANQIDLSWTDNSNNEDGFKIERKSGAGGTYTQVGIVGPVAMAYSDTGLTCDITYFYRIRAYNSAGDSGYAHEVFSKLTCPLTAPTAPSSLTSTVISYSRINIYWVDNSNNEDGFKIERKTGSGGTYSLIYTTTFNITSYLDTGLAPDNTYYYQVYAYNSTANSGYSNEKNATTQSFSIQMASIPTGCFNMGDAFNEGNSDELPVHNVCISAFHINVYEVTNEEYKACVDVGSCTVPQNSSSYTRSSYYGNATYDNYPVIYVDWGQAKVFCQWTGGRLPTEAEWEYAARGGLASKRYPWGNNAPTCILGAADGAQHDSCSPDDTIMVGSFAPNGYGLDDMAGNVWEWVSDLYDGAYYSSSPSQDPQGPSWGSYRAIRGSSWYNSAYDLGSMPPTATHLRVAERYYYTPTLPNSSIGFRCAK